MESQKMQEARLYAADRSGYVAIVQVPAFPDNPQLVKLPDGRLFGDGTIGYGVDYLTYTQMDTPYDVEPGADGK